MTNRVCPKCGGQGFIRDSWTSSLGVRRRMHCSCGNRWTDFDGKPPLPARKRPPPVLSLAEQRIIAVRERRLTTDQVRLILTRLDISTREFGRLLNNKRQTISNVRRGLRYANVLPELPRVQAVDRSRVCTKCRHWSGEWCGLGWPDPVEDGLTAALFCDDYERL